MIDETQLQNIVKGHSLIRAVDQVPKGHLRMETAFHYPDGSSIDVFVVQETPASGALKLSDLGQTTSWLLDVQVRPWLSKKRQRFVEDAIKIYRISQSGGALECPMNSLEEVVDGVVRLGQACVRVADLTYTRRSSLQSVVTEDLEEFLADSDLEFETNKELPGRRGSLVRVDFLVHRPKVDSALLTLSSGNAAQAHSASNEIFRRWYDLSARNEQKVTIFDDRYDVYRDEDLARLRDLSDVVALSDKTAIRDLLAA